MKNDMKLKILKDVIKFGALAVRRGDVISTESGWKIHYTEVPQGFSGFAGMVIENYCGFFTALELGSYEIIGN